MSDPQERHQILEIPPQLYDKLTEWCHAPTAPISGDTVQEWTELLSTQEFKEVIHEDTSNNLIGLLRAFGAFPFEDNLRLLNKLSSKSFSVTLKDSSEQEDDQQKAVFGDLPDVLAKAICRMTHLQTISLDLGPFNVEDGLKLDDATMINRPLVIWPEMHLIRIRGPNVHAGCIMGRCDRLQLKALDVDKYWMILQEADSDRSNEFSSEGDVHKIKNAFEQVRKGLRSIKATRLAFHFDYRRFTPKIIRSDLGMLNTTSGPLEGHDIKQWHEMWIEYPMTVRTLQEVWIFTNSSLAFAGTRNSDETVTIECLKIVDFCWDT
ncbi:hypothetical protein FSPOR_7927 [Fusarium sporotrichioides]|uniref:Uncharacterized protein n=1 Tax=Fusarium sporotrichioides TaxID=5514 RepID=A0A395RWT9_FUSSP|nr:hypothetical protein FSPOR_7927 [Fusarium sporotrichioides]